MKKHLSYILLGILIFAGAYAIRSTATAVTGYSRTFDGGRILSVVTPCTCSGGTLILFQSYVDQTPQQYVYQLGGTILYSYYNIFTPGNAFLSTHFPYGICMVVTGTSCSQTGLPQGALTQIGSSASPGQ